MYNVKFVIPKADNNGRYYDKAVFAQIEKNLLDITGGLSKYDVAGQWVDAGTVYTDNSVVYDLVVDDDQQVDALRALVTALKKPLAQLSMFFSVSQVEVSFL